MALTGPLGKQIRTDRAISSIKIKRQIPKTTPIFLYVSAVRDFYPSKCQD
jgi:hypothetical protein